MQQYDVIILGAGAAGLMCAIQAGRRGRSVLVADHASKVGKKILYFIGEVVDVTGWLGGYNFQWAWASGYAAGEAV